MLLGAAKAMARRKALEIVGLLEQVRFKCIPQTREAPGSVPIG